jgi:colicin import membrane protein
MEPKPPAPVQAPPVAPAPAIPPKPVIPQQEAAAEKAEVKLASKTLKPTPPQAKQPEPTAVIARATAPAVKATNAPPRPTAPAVKPTAVLAQKPTPNVAATAAAKTASETEAREKQIAAAVQRRAQDQQISDAIQRRAAAVHAPASGTEGTGTGGPVSIGSGTGSGGVVEGLEMILYRGQMEKRIKENWVWAGEDLALEVKVQFDITAKGEIQNVRITGSSGNPSYDASAQRAVRAASPLAPPPEKYRDLFVHGVEITFRAQDLQS